MVCVDRRLGHFGVIEIQIGSISVHLAYRILATLGNSEHLPWLRMAVSCEKAVAMGKLNTLAIAQGRAHHALPHASGSSRLQLELLFGTNRGGQAAQHPRSGQRLA